MAIKSKKMPVLTNGTPPDDVPNHPLARCIPRGDRVVIRRDVAKRQTEGGILLPAVSIDEHKQQIGCVWAVGPGAYDKDGNRVPIGLAKGDRVIITGFAGLEIRDPLSNQSDEFVILREEDVLAVVPD